MPRHTPLCADRLPCLRFRAVPILVTSLAWLFLSALAPRVALSQGHPADTDSLDSITDDITYEFADLLDYDLSFETHSGQTWQDLGLNFLEPGSEVLRREGALLQAGRDYRLDAELGRVELFGDWPGGRLQVRVRRRPLALPRLMELSPLRAWQDLEASMELPPAAAALPLSSEPEERAKLDPGTFVLGGSKALILKMGSSEDVTLEQSLRLNLQGQISDSSRVEAVLRDDELPYQPEGNTERLEELDKVFLRISGPAGQAQVGDFVFEMKDREITPFRRDFKGIQGDWGASRGGVSAWLARSQGVFKTVEFYGQDGNQGPYELLSALRDNRAVILAGSETVAVNGRALTRGRDRDYIIDYDLGTLTFTTRASVGSADIVRVDFRFSQEHWRRGAWGAGGRGRLGGLQLSLFHFEEEDDRERPLATILDEERLRILAEAGNDPDRAVTSGVIPRPGEGHYILTYENQSDPEFPTYAWVDSLGDYDLRFREVGVGRGDYRFVGISARGERIFAYAQPESGTFSLGEQLVPPEAYRLETLRADYRAGALDVEAEAALSDRDGNLLSTLDDDHNAGVAFRGKLRADLGESAGRALALDLRAKRRDDRFRYPGERPGSEHYRRWNLPWDPGLLEEENAQLTLSWGSLEGEGLELSSEGLRLGERFEGAKGGVGMSERFGAYRLRGAMESIISSDSLLGRGWRHKALGDLSTDLPLLRGVAMDWEERYSEKGDALGGDLLRLEQRPNFMRRGAELRLGSRVTGLPWSINWREELIQSSGDTDQVSRLLASYHEGLPGEGRLDLSGNYQKRRGSNSSEQFAVESRAVWIPSPGGWGGEAFYQLSSRQQRLQESQLIEVGPGQGNLNEWGVYVGEGEGDYRRVTLPGETQLPVNELEMKARLQRNEAREGSWLSRLGSDTRFTLREQTRNANFWRLARLDPELLRQEGVSLLSELELRQELRLRPLSRGPELRYRFNGIDLLDARDSFGQRSNRLLEHQLRLRQVSSAGEVQFEVSQKREQRRDALGIGGGNYRSLERRAELSWTRHITRRIQTTLRAGLGDLSDADRDLDLRQTVLEPHLSLSPIDILRLDGKWEFSHSQYLKGDPTTDRPYFFDAPGWKRTLRLQATLQAGAYLTLSAQYELRQEVDRPRWQRMRMEGRAFF